MADEEAMVATQTQDQAGEQQTETQQQAAQDDGLAELRKSAAPDMADVLGDMTPEQRERILLTRLAERRATDASKETGGAAAASTDGSASRVPQPLQVSQAALDRLKAPLKEMLGEEGATAIAQYLGENMQLMVSALTAQDRVLREVAVPNEFRVLLEDGAVPEATRADVTKAREYLDRGDARTAVAALKLAVFDRKDAVARAKKNPAQTEADLRRRRESRQASDLSLSGQEPAETVLEMPATGDLSSGPWKKIMVAGMKGAQK